MRTKSEAMISREELSGSRINDEYIFRDLARSMVNEMPIDDLQKLIKFTKVDPLLIDDRIKLYHAENDYSKHIIDDLINRNTILYKAEVNLP